MFNAKKFCDDYNIETRSEKKGWVNIRCPFCSGRRDWRGGFNIDGEYYNCWRCGWHWLPKVVSVLVGSPIYLAGQIIAKYLTSATHIDYKKRIYAKEISLPYGTDKVQTAHLRYLLSRGLNRDTVRQWGLMGTNHIGKYKFRIIIPIYLDGELISYTSRDITGKSQLRYKACEEKDEVYHHKYSLYGIDQAKKDTCIIVEGPVDVWKIGPDAIGTFGINFDKRQVAMISQRFKNIFICFDAEDEAQKMAYKLSQELGKYPLVESVEIIDIGDNDPGSLSRQEVKHLRKEINLV